MAQTTVKYPTVAADLGGSYPWTNIANATGTPDGVNATSASILSGIKGNLTSNVLQLSSLILAIPNTAIITGVQAVITGVGPLLPYTGMTITLRKADGTYGILSGGSYNFGSNGDTAGLTLSAADVNAAGFGVGISIYSINQTNNVNMTVDAVQVTIFWDYPPLVNGTIQKSYVYQVFNQGVYLGLLPNVTTDFAVTQDINTAGSSITIKCGVTADVSAFDIPLLETEDGQTLQTEIGDNMTLEAYPDAVGNNNTNAFFKNGNQIIVYEYSNYHFNGIKIFSGDIEKWSADFGSSSGDVIEITCYSDGSDLNNFLITGGDTLDQSSSVTNRNTDLYVDYLTQGNTYDWVGQTFITGAGVTTLSSIGVYLSFLSTSFDNFTMYVYYSAAIANAGGAPLGQTTVIANYVTGGGGEIKFSFTPAIIVTPLTQYFFVIKKSTDGQGAFAAASTNPYANGTVFTAGYGGGSGGGTLNAIAGTDLCFNTYYGGTSTTSSYVSTDPAAMVKDMITRYVAKGGLINTASGSIDLTALSLSYTFKVATLLEGIQKALALAPYNWYWYVDIGSNILFFKQTSTTAKWQLIKGNHISSLTLAASTENVKNTIYFTGGIAAGNTVNLFSTYTDAGSVQNNKQRLTRQTDNRVTVQATADAIGNSFVGFNKNESYQTTVVVLDTTMDISQFKLGDTVSPGGFGGFIDRLVLQIVRIQKTPEQVTMKLGELPPMVNQTIKNIQQGLNDLQTLQNP